MKSLNTSIFGNTLDGRAVNCITISDGEGSSADILNFGAALRAVRVKGRNGKPIDVCLGYDTCTPYESGSSCMGGLMGRCVNRIAGSHFSIDGKSFDVSPNRGSYHIHGGWCGFHKKLWDFKADDRSVILNYTSENLEEGYPGTLKVTATYSWKGPGLLSLLMQAETNAPTVVNLTSHTYFNLDGTKDILSERLSINSSDYVFSGENGIPTGRLIPVFGTPFDFSSQRTIGERIHNADPMLQKCGGYDVCYLPIGEGRRRVAVLESDYSGIRMEVESDLPALQLYTANALCDKFGKNGTVYRPWSGVCLEPQYVPNAVNLSGFEKPIFTPERQYSHSINYCFSCL